MKIQETTCGHKGRGLEVTYGTTKSDFGEMTVGWTAAGLCWLGFGGVLTLRAHFPQARLVEDLAAARPWAQEALQAWARGTDGPPLDLHGTAFQMRVWRALLDIPRGETMSYGEIARKIGKPKAYRAVGSAVGGNPVSILVPCHRVLPASGGIGHYAWGAALKKRLLEAERTL